MKDIEKLKAEHKELKERLHKLIDFMNSKKALKKSTGGRYWHFFADYIWALPTFNIRWGALFRCRWGAGVWW